jgi:hypothetical protein
MIDFLSTRLTTDSQAASCARFIAAIIGYGIRDLCIPLSRDEIRRQRNNLEDAVASLEFVWGRDRWVFDGFAKIVGTTGDHIRDALLRLPTDEFAKKPMFTDLDRRTISARHRMFIEEKHLFDKPANEA